jgi:two-component system chemotaxis sensor kinase CheA
MTGNPYEGFLQEFLLDARERVGQVEEGLLAFGSAGAEDRQLLIENVRRDLHTIKGNAAMMGFADMQELAHRMEEEIKGVDTGAVDVVGLLKSLDQLRRSLQVASGEEEQESLPDVHGAQRADQSAAASVRVPFAAIDSLIDLVAEMVIFRNRVTDAITRGLELRVASAKVGHHSREAWGEVQLAFETLGGTLDAIRDRVMRLRMIPLRTLFSSLERIVFDEARKEGKAVRLETSGGDTPLDKALLELANEALGHLVRNAVNHGQESTEQRVAVGKPSTGTVRIGAAADATEVVIQVSDDGAGIDREHLLHVAAERGIDLTTLGDAYSLLFLPGFSTRTQASVSAGRGVGLSAVQEAVRRRGGRIEVASQPGRGTSFCLRLPLSVSIAPALLLRVDAEEYALPLTSVVESQRLRPSDRHNVNGAGVWTWRDQLIPLLDLGHALGTAGEIRDHGHVIVVEAAGKHRALLVDEIRGIQEVVVKGLDTIVGTPPGIGGSTVLGDGRAILILDPRGLVEMAPFVEAAA